MEPDGSPNVRPFPQDYNLSCLSLISKAKHLLLEPF